MALYSHTTRAAGTILTAVIYNTDHQNHVDNQIPTKMEDSSANVAGMQANTDPGDVGTESLATSLQGEIERLRFQLKAVTGEAQWYVPPATDLATVGAVPAGSLRLLSYQKFTSSNSWNKPANVTAVFVQVFGSGGGGGGATATTAVQASAGSGGGSGGYGEELITSALLDPETVTIDGGGAGGVGVAGAAGGVTSFGAHVGANGGGGGTTAAATEFNTAATGGAPAASGTGGGVNLPGGGGGSCAAQGTGDTNTGLGEGGHGGNGYGGGGGKGSVATATVNGAPGGANTGGGGGGAANGVSQSAATGGAGGSGLVIVWEFG